MSEVRNLRTGALGSLALSIFRQPFFFLVCVAVYFAKRSLIKGYSFHAKSVRNRYKKFQEVLIFFYHDWPIICLTSSKHVLLL